MDSVEYIELSNTNTLDEEHAKLQSDSADDEFNKHQSKIKRDLFIDLDNAEWGASHWRAVLVGGSGFLTDSYDNFIIGLMVPMIAYVYYPDSNGKLSNVDDGFIKAISGYGNLVGQITFGVLGDLLGRKKIYGIELIILIVGALGCAMAAQPEKGVSFLVILGFWRFILGFGGVIASEFASVKNRGFMIALVFAMQGIGILLGALVTVCVLAIFKTSIEQDYKNFDYCWRIMAGFGILPALSAVYYRLSIPETPRFTMDQGDTQTALKNAKDYLNLDPSNEHTDSSTDRNHSTVSRPLNFSIYYNRFISHFSIWNNAKILLATSLCWFLLDIGYYGTNLNTHLVLNTIGYSDMSSPFQNVWTAAKGALILALAGNIPGYFFTVYYIDKWGRKPIQFMGFAMLTICFALFALLYQPLKESAPFILVIIYATAQFFFNFGPNSTTFIIPAEVFPTHVRSSGHGISAASGKLGAILAAQLFSQMINIGGPHASISYVLAFFSVLCFLGFLLTFWLPETNGRSLEEISDCQ